MKGKGIQAKSVIQRLVDIRGGARFSSAVGAKLANKPVSDCVAFRSMFIVLTPY